MNNITLAVDHGARSGYSIFTNGKYTHSGIVFSLKKEGKSDP